MRIDELVNDRQPKQQTPANLQEIYQREDDPKDQYHKDLDDLYNPNKQYTPCD